MEIFEWKIRWNVGIITYQKRARSSDPDALISFPFKNSRKVHFARAEEKLRRN